MYTLWLSHTAMMHYIAFSHTAVKNDNPGINLPRHIYCDSSHLSILQAAQCSVGMFKRGWLYNNQTLIKLAAPLPEIHALKWALLVRYKGQNAEKDWKSEGHHSSKAAAVNSTITWCCVGWGESRQDQRDNPSIRGVLWSALHDGHDISPCKAACLY